MGFMQDQNLVVILVLVAAAVHLPVAIRSVEDAEDGFAALPDVSTRELCHVRKVRRLLPAVFRDETFDRHVIQ